MDITKPNKDLNELNPVFKAKVDARLKEVGDIIFVVEGYRPQERQEYLYAQGRTRPGSIVTQTLTSNHTGHNAVDIGFKGGTLYPSSTDPRWRQVADKAIKYGINRGGDWTTFKDRPHFESNGKPLLLTDDMSKYTEVLNAEIKKSGEQPIFTNHDGEGTLTEQETKELIDIAVLRVLQRLKK